MKGSPRVEALSEGLTLIVIHIVISLPERETYWVNILAESLDSCHKRIERLCMQRKSAIDVVLIVKLW